MPRPKQLEVPALSVEDTLVWSRCPTQYFFNNNSNKKAAAFHPFELYCKFIFESYIKSVLDGSPKNPVDLFMTLHDLYTPKGRQTKAWLLKVGVKRFTTLINLCELDKLTPMTGATITNTKAVAKPIIFSHSISLTGITTVGYLKAYSFTNMKSRHEIEWSWHVDDLYEKLTAVAKEIGYKRGSPPQLVFLYMDNEYHFHRFSHNRIVADPILMASKEDLFLAARTQFYKGQFSAKHCPNEDCIFRSNCHPYKKTASKNVEEEDVADEEPDKADD